MIAFLILLCSLFATAYIYSVRHFDYWKKRGIVYIKPYPFVGNLGPLFQLKCAIGEYLYEIYKDYENYPYVGIFFADKPCLLVRDYELVNRILTKDFHYFNNRIITFPKKTDPIGARSLFSVHGKEWKNTRAKLSPIFTTKKQKVVFETMLGVGKKFETLLNQKTSINIKELSTCFAVDTISDAVLGLDGRAIFEPQKDQMRKLGELLFEETFQRALRTNMLMLVPELMDFLKIPLFSKSGYQIMIDATKSALKKKENENYRGDYIDSLLDLRKKGPWEGNDGEMIEPDDENMVGQLFMFFTAGYETAASGVVFCLYELAKNSDIQRKVRTDIFDTINVHDGELTYEAVNDMSYLNKFITECLRKHPPFPFIDRICSADYTIPGTNVVIEKGTKLMISMLGLHRDEKYYHDPESIIPERFDDAALARDKPYFPFSMGPRTCLGMRFAQQLLKVCIVSTLKGHELKVSPMTPDVIRMSPRRFGNTPICDVILDVKKLEASDV